jgi:hypothetical protein
MIARAASARDEDSCQFVTLLALSPGWASVWPLMEMRFGRRSMMPAITVRSFLV